MAMKHTPGPWGAYNLSKGNIAIETREGVRVANASGDTCDVEANARLIAAAPELLAALKAAYSALALIDDFGTATGENPDVQNAALDQARAAIAKAEGG